MDAKDLFAVPESRFVFLLTVMLAGLPSVAKAQAGGIRIAWDYRTLTRVGERGGDYARMERIGSSDTLALAYGYGGLRLSPDNGKAWGPRIAAALDTFPNAHPANVELTYLDDGTLLLPYNYRAYGEDGVSFQIRVNASSDGGKTWKQRAVVFKAGDRAGRGVWEPAIIQLPSGELQLFAANEYPYPEGPAQEITMWRSQDNGKTWSKGQTISKDLPFRDGMPVPLVLNDNKGIAVAIEDFGWGDGCGVMARPTIVHSPFVENSWTDTPIRRQSEHRWRALSSSAQLNCSQSGPAPYLEQFPQNETVLSFHSNIAPFGPREELASTMVVAIGNDEAKNFRNKSYPFGNPSRPAGPDEDCGGNGVCGVAAIWNSLFVKDSSTVTAVTSTGAFGGGTFIIDGHRISEPVAYETPSKITVDGKLDEQAWQTAHATFVGARSPAHATYHPVWEEDHLHLACEASDQDLWVEEGNLQNSDGCIFDLHQLTSGTFRVRVSAAGDALFQQRIRGEWRAWNPDAQVAAQAEGTLGSPGDEDDGFTAEVALPWTELGGKPISGRGMGISYGLAKRFSVGREYAEEHVSGNDPERTETWQRLRLGGTTDAKSSSGRAVAATAQLASYPNPFREEAVIEYTLPHSSQVTLAVYDLLGQKVATLTEGWRPVGQHEMKLKGSNWPSGVYVVRLITSTGATRTHTVTLAR